MKCPKCGKEMRSGYLLPVKMALSVLQMKFQVYLKKQIDQTALLKSHS